ncbi:MAG: hypothetical protein A2219_08395 [Elusimicrobia bacterium RIFOXYA2_FULL_50_26]|nr:MAG: hypothetical protein A2219_08395 [Elusimicrobia bacterium RIFOXYA2_FULL_50_26]
MKKILIIIIALASVTATAAFFQRKAAKAQRLREVAPSVGSIALSFRETGTVSPRNRIELKPPVSGRVEDVLITEGRKVKKGEIIAWMSSSDRAALLDAARAKGEAELNKWNDVYKPTPIIAPLDGFIIARAKEPGQSVTMSDVIAVMADTLIVKASVDETDLRYIAIGQTVEISLDAYPGKKFGGIVEHVAYESELINNVTVYEVNIRPLSVPTAFRAGMTATVEVTAKKNERALLLPLEAIVARNGGKFVMLKTNTKKPRYAPVETGIISGKTAEIISGITEGDTVLMPQNDAREKKTSTRMGGIPGMGRR